MDDVAAFVCSEQFVVSFIHNAHVGAKGTSKKLFYIHPHRARSTSNNDFIWGMFRLAQVFCRNVLVEIKHSYILFFFFVDFAVD